MLFRSQDQSVHAKLRRLLNKALCSVGEHNIRALSGGVTTDKIFAMVEKIRKNTQIPMVFMTYANVVFSYGTERFIKKASELGMDGLILPPPLRIQAAL